jgi:hypothetical protein
MLTNFMRFNGSVEKIEKMLIIQTLRNLVTFVLKHATKLLKIQKKKNPYVPETIVQIRADRSIKRIRWLSKAPNLIRPAIKKY